MPPLSPTAIPDASRPGARTLALVILAITLAAATITDPAAAQSPTTTTEATTEATTGASSSLTSERPSLDQPASADSEIPGITFDDDPVPVEGREFVRSGQVWDRTDLTYGITTRTPDLSRPAQEAALRRAFDTWEANSALTFTEVPDCRFAHNDTRCAEPDIRILFGRGRHSTDRNDRAFDGRGGTVAHAFGPSPDRFADQVTSPGDIHFDDAELWRIDRVVDLQTVATHEIGHAIGLAHAAPSRCPARTSAGRPIMCATVYGLQHQLAADDVHGVRALYGTWPRADTVGVRLLGPRTVPVGSRTTYTVMVGNGYAEALRTVSVQAQGADDCTRTSLPNIAPGSSIRFSCTIDAPPSFDGFSVGETLAATFSVAGDLNGTTEQRLTLAVAPPTNDLRDVPAWVSGAVDWAQYHGIASGYRNDTFRPDADITRAALVQMIYRLAGSPDTAGWPDHGFTDVPSWAEDAITWAATDQDGDGPGTALVEGYANGTFRPYEPITRAATSRVLFRFAGAPGGYPFHYLHHVPIFVDDAVRWGANDPDGDGPAAEIIAGYPGRQFHPYRPITRAATVRMIYRTSALLDL